MLNLSLLYLVICIHIAYLIMHTCVYIYIYLYLYMHADVHVSKLYILSNTSVCLFVILMVVYSIVCRMLIYVYMFFDGFMFFAPFCANFFLL